MLIELAGLPNYTHLSDVPIVRKLISAILSTENRCEDFKYFITLEGNRIVFRGATVLDDYVQTSPILVRRQQNRDRFAAAVSEARTQLLRYRDWFRVESNREHLKATVGMKIYEPHLSVIIGRSSEFVDEFDRQRLASDNPDIEVVTYDDLLTFVNRRRLILGDE